MFGGDDRHAIFKRQKTYLAAMIYPKVIYVMFLKSVRGTTTNLSVHLSYFPHGQLFESQDILDKSNIHILELRCEICRNIMFCFRQSW